MIFAGVWMMFGHSGWWGNWIAVIVSTGKTPLSPSASPSPFFSGPSSLLPFHLFLSLLLSLLSLLFFSSPSLPSIVAAAFSSFNHTH